MKTRKCAVEVLERRWMLAPGAVLAVLQTEPVCQNFDGPVLVWEEPVASIPPVRHSNPGAGGTIFLDFDGYAGPLSWERYKLPAALPGFSLDADHRNYTDQELRFMLAVWDAVSEDFAPFQVDVTTLATLNPTVHVVIQGGTGDWLGGEYGAASLQGNLLYSSSVVVHVFPDNLSSQVSAKPTADIISHAIGHAAGLQHQRLFSEDGTLLQERCEGEYGRAPLMGWSAGSLCSQWWFGTSAAPDAMQDDLSQLDYVFGRRIDDSWNENPPTGMPMLQVDNLLTSQGVVSHATDRDSFSFEMKQPGWVTFTAGSESVSPNMRILLELYDLDGAMLASMAPANDFELSLHLSSAGTYFAVMQASVLNEWYGYGELGQYVLNGVIAHD